MVNEYEKPASGAQVRYLTNLGYVEPASLLMREASIAIAEMLKSGDAGAAHNAILAERTARQQAAAAQQKARRQADREGTPTLVEAAPVETTPGEQIVGVPEFVMGGLAAVACWIISRFIALLAWLFSTLAILLIWLPSQAGLLAARSAAVKVETGRQKVIPWIGASDWRLMATGCRMQAIAATRQVDALLVQASRGDRWLLLALRFATASAAGIICWALLWVF